MQQQGYDRPSHNPALEAWDVFIIMSCPLQMHICFFNESSMQLSAHRTLTPAIDSCHRLFVTTIKSLILLCWLL